jgi:hypothetical protein
VALLSRHTQLAVALPPAQVLARLEAELRGVRGPMLDGHLPQFPAGQRWAGHVEEGGFVLRRAAHGDPLTRNLHAITRGRVEAAPGGGSRLHLTLRPAWLDSPPWLPLLGLSAGGVGLALWDGKPELFGLVLLLWCVPLVLGLLGRPLLGGEEREVKAALAHLLR